jgi:NADPH-dependent curcumin reductase
MNRLVIQGFIMAEYMPRAEEAIAALIRAFEEGKLNITGSDVLVQKPFEELPNTWALLFEGKNSGKTIVQIALL